METKLRRKVFKDNTHNGLYDEKLIVLNNQIVGKPDGETDTHVIERKALKYWKHAIGQVLVYSHCLRKRPKMVLIEEVPTSPDYKRMISDICSKLHIEVEMVLYDDAKRDSSVIDNDWRYLLKKEHLYELAPSDSSKTLNKDQLCSACKEKTLDDLKKDHLYYIAGKIQVKHRSSMKKDQLLTILKERFPTSVPVSTSARTVPSPDLSTLRVDQLRDYIKKMGIAIPSKYIKKEDLISIAKDPSTLASILTRL